MRVEKIHSSKYIQMLRDLRGVTPQEEVKHLEAAYQCMRFYTSSLVSWGEALGFHVHGLSSIPDWGISTSHMARPKNQKRFYIKACNI